MKVFVAGATGTLGLPLVRALVALKHQVTGLTRSAEKRSMLEQLGAAATVADALDAASLEKALRAASPDCVFHLLTAIPKNTLLRASHMKQTNMLRTTGTANLLKASVAAGVKRIVAESMVFAYGFGDHGDRAKSEGDVVQQSESESWLQPMVDALRSLETQLLTANEQRLIESVVLRYGFFYGSAGASGYIVKMLRRRMLPRVKGSHGITPWIHIEDAVNASIAAMERGRAGEIYYIVDDESVGMNEWLTHAALSLEAKPPFSIPHWLLRLISPYMATVFDTRLVVSNRKAKDELHWRLQYSSYREGLREMATHL
jgi:nucleoside-diphosphate-sugar epimerase